MPSEVVIFPPPHHAYGLILGDLTVDDLDRDGTREEGCRTSMTGGRSRKEICSTSATAGPRRCHFQHNDNIDMTTEGDSIPLPDEDTYMDTEGEERWERGVNMGHGLQRLTRARRGKLPVVLAEGMTTPVTLVIAAKFATE
ncbi:hypothetical protein GUJ93_ZPchr0004g38297 [Zizania palustris]|uniref:Uncharacterized protein n=1 Tax=Zizania palustris TaxID=103762 RepID=A0A8J5SR04_ZIZPA|nr:hypothetical protein GUJ93_ZPchr0004g38297 [Zizania palustris]